MGKVSIGKGHERKGKQECSWSKVWGKVQEGTGVNIWAWGKTIPCYNFN